MQEMRAGKSPLWFLTCLSPSQHIATWTSHISHAQEPHTAQGHLTGYPAALDPSYSKRSLLTSYICTSLGAHEKCQNSFTFRWY